MFGSARERVLGLMVICAGLYFGGSYIYKNSGESIWLQQDDISQRQDAIENLLDKQNESGEIVNRYEKMVVDLAVDGDDSRQLLTIREQISGILEQAKLDGKYRSLNPKDTEKENDFKVISFSIEDIECTPGQLGALLNIIEKQSTVMEVTRCNISNQIRDNGEIGYGRRGLGDDTTELLSGLLQVDLEISRLVEYRDGEKPKKRTTRRRN